LDLNSHKIDENHKINEASARLPHNNSSSAQRQTFNSAESGSLPLKNNEKVRNSAISQSSKKKFDG
jgi:hypothetical protein